MIISVSCDLDVEITTIYARCLPCTAHLDRDWSDLATSYEICYAGTRNTSSTRRSSMVSVVYSPYVLRGCNMLVGSKSLVGLYAAILTQNAVQVRCSGGTKAR